MARCTTQNVHAELSSRFMLRRFPFDEQSLNIHLSPFINDISGETLGIASQESAIRAEERAYNSLAQWEVGSITAPAPARPVSSKGVTEVIFSIHVKRHYGFYVWKVFIPLLLMVFLSWSVFWVDPFDLPTRCRSR